MADCGEIGREIGDRIIRERPGLESPCLRRLILGITVVIIYYS